TLSLSHSINSVTTFRTFSRRLRFHFRYSSTAPELQHRHLHPCSAPVLICPAVASVSSLRWQTCIPHPFNSHGKSPISFLTPSFLYAFCFCDDTVLSERFLIMLIAFTPWPASSNPITSFSFAVSLLPDKSTCNLKCSY